MFLSVTRIVHGYALYIDGLLSQLMDVATSFAQGDAGVMDVSLMTTSDIPLVSKPSS